MTDPSNPRPCPNCGNPNTRITDFDPPFSATLTCDACEYDSTLDEDDKPTSIQKRITLKIPDKLMKKHPLAESLKKPWIVAGIGMIAYVGGITLYYLSFNLIDKSSGTVNLPCPPGTEWTTLEPPRDDLAFCKPIEYPLP